MLRKRSREFATVSADRSEKERIVPAVSEGKPSDRHGGSYFRNRGGNPAAADHHDGVLFRFQRGLSTLHIQMSGWCLLMTAGCYFACYLFALMRNKRVFKKMSIAELIQMEKKNEDLKVKHEKVRQWLVFRPRLYPLCLLHDGPGLFHPHGADSDGRFCRCYLCHVCGICQPLSSAECRRKTEECTAETAFSSIRQLASKVRTMRFTMGTLTFCSSALCWEAPFL